MSLESTGNCRRRYAAQLCHIFDRDRTSPLRPAEAGNVWGIGGHGSGTEILSVV